MLHMIRFCLPGSLAVMAMATLLAGSPTCAAAADRVALVIGCGAYQAASELDTPVNDARRITAKLGAAPLNFDVVQVLEATRNDFFDGLDEFKQRAQGAKIVMVYFSGHGIELDGLNYCVPVDAKLEKPSHVESEAVELGKILAALHATGAEAKIAVLDACRNNPFGQTKSWRNGQGKSVSGGVLAALGDAQLPEATLVCFATSPGRKAAALLNDDSENSPFTEFLLQRLATPGAPLRDVFETTADAVANATERRQLPYVKYDGAASVLRQLILVPAAPAAPLPAPAVAAMVPPPAPMPTPAPVAAAMVPAAAMPRPQEALRPMPAGPPGALDRGAVGETFEVRLQDGLSMTFCFCPAGRFIMGSPAAEDNRNENEAQVPVQISKGFWLARTECTQGQWQAVMGPQPGAASTEATFPAETGRWADAQQFVARLNAALDLGGGWKFALPTEAQWEYGCRAGTTTAYSFGNELTDADARVMGRKPVAAGRYRPNAWGLHDMHGNLAEWCADWYQERLVSGVDPAGPASASRAVVRGGSFWSGAANSRSATREGSDPEDALHTGFRLAIVQTEGR